MRDPPILLPLIHWIQKPKPKAKLLVEAIIYEYFGLDDLVIHSNVNLMN